MTTVLVNQRQPSNTNDSVETTLDRCSRCADTIPKGKAVRANARESYHGKCAPSDVASIANNTNNHQETNTMNQSTQSLGQLANANNSNVVVDESVKALVGSEAAYEANLVHAKSVVESARVTPLDAFDTIEGALDAVEELAGVQYPMHRKALANIKQQKLEALVDAGFRVVLEAARSAGDAQSAFDFVRAQEQAHGSRLPKFFGQCVELHRALAFEKLAKREESLLSITDAVERIIAIRALEDETKAPLNRAYRAAAGPARAALQPKVDALMAKATTLATIAEAAEFLGNIQQNTGLPYTKELAALEARLQEQAAPAGKPAVARTVPSAAVAPAQPRVSAQPKAWWPKEDAIYDGLRVECTAAAPADRAGIVAKYQAQAVALEAEAGTSLSRLHRTLSRYAARLAQDASALPPQKGQAFAAAAQPAPSTTVLVEEGPAPAPEAPAVPQVQPTVKAKGQHGKAAQALRGSKPAAATARTDVGTMSAVEKQVLAEAQAKLASGESLDAVFAWVDTQEAQPDGTYSMEDVVAALKQGVVASAQAAAAVSADAVIAGRN